MNSDRLSLSFHPPRSLEFTSTDPPVCQPVSQVFEPLVRTWSPSRVDFIPSHLGYLGLYLIRTWRQWEVGWCPEKNWHSSGKQLLWVYHRNTCMLCCCSVTQSCLTLCNPMDCSMPVFPVLQCLQELAQTQVYRVGDAIQPSHPLSSPSPPAPNISQHQSLF